MSGERAKMALDEIIERLGGEPSDTVNMLRRFGGGVVFEEFPGQSGSSDPRQEVIR